MAKAVKLKWTVAPAPTGRYRSFEKRGWPQCRYVLPPSHDDAFRPAASISSDTEYTPDAAKTGLDSWGDPVVLVVRIAVHNERSFEWKRVKQSFNTLEAAKAAAEHLIQANPSFWPKELRDAE